MSFYVRHLNCEGVKLSRITTKDREITKNLNYSGINFPVSKKDYDKIGVMKEININVLFYEDKIIYPIYLSNQSFNDTLDLLLISNHYMYIKDFLQGFSSQKVLKDPGKDCLFIN